LLAALTAISVWAQNRSSVYLLGQASGTARNPASWSMPMTMTRTDQWDLMWMGQAFVVDTQQSGPRGGDKLYSANWGMLGATRTTGRGAVMLRAMVSLDPLTVTGRYYPLLFQTGETAYGKPIVDGQHPHDFVMELSAQYVRPLSSSTLLTLYYAPVGDAASGPVAFPHRASAMEIPQATTGHHWLDSTHIATNLATVGLDVGKVRFEASGFHGTEPNENRWNFDMGGMDSWSTRVVYRPSFRWLAQTSYANLKNPETTHAGDVRRVTTSVQYTRPLASISDRAGWSSTIAWARNHKVAEGRGTQAVLAETLLPVTRRDIVSGRFEWSQRDELFPEHDEEHGESHVYDVAAFTAGYTRGLGQWKALSSAVGVNVTAYAIADGLKPHYGSHPVGANFFVRFRLQDGE
jgi:hypothetical protein